MSRRIRLLISTAEAAAFTAALLCASTAPGAAALATFTFNPAAAGLTSPLITSDKVTVNDYAKVTLGASSSGSTAFTETGYLQFNDYETPGTSSFFTTPGESFYIAFSATGTQNAPTVTSNSTGTFSSLNYTLYGENGTASFSTASGTPTVTDASKPTALATGSLVSGSTGLSVVTLPTGGTGYSPNATVVNTVNPLIPGFFASPTPASLHMFGAYNNDARLVTVTGGGTGFLLNGGGGDITFTEAAGVPEPAGLAAIGSGLLAVFAFRRRA